MAPLSWITWVIELLDDQLARGAGTVHRDGVGVHASREAFEVEDSTLGSGGLDTEVHAAHDRTGHAGHFKGLLNELSLKKYKLFNEN